MMKYKIYFNGTEYDIEPCPEGHGRDSEIAKKYPASEGWQLLETAETMDQATFRIEEHRNRIKAEAR
jgi:hypothetical protein